MTRKRDYGWLKDAAKLGGKARWEGVSDEERSAYARKIRAKVKLTKQQRIDAARKAVAARWKRYYAARPENRRTRVRKTPS